MFDTSKEVLIKGKVVRFDWKNPHMYLIVETVGEDGKKQLIQGEGLAITQALVDGLHQKDLPVGAPVVMRANPNRSGPGKTVRLLDVTTQDGETLVIDTIAFEPNPSGLFVNIPSSAQKHTIERLTLTDDRRRLRYESTVEDPEYLGKPSSFTMLWDYRPDLKPSPRSEACDPAIARRYREY
jgi:hypothetical protein